MKRNILLAVFLSLSTFMHGGNSITLKRFFLNNGHTISYRLGNEGQELFAILGAFENKEPDMDVNDKFIIETSDEEIVFVITEDILESPFEDGLRFSLTPQQLQSMSTGAKTITYHKHSSGSQYSNTNKVSLHKLARIILRNYKKAGGIVEKKVKRPKEKKAKTPKAIKVESRKETKVKSPKVIKAESRKETIAKRPKETKEKSPTNIKTKGVYPSWRD